MNNRSTVVLASPYGQTGGGMGSIMTYLASLQHGPTSRYNFKCVETRGGGHVAVSPLFVTLAAGRIVREAAARRLALVHINLAEGGSVYRKAILLAVTKAVGGRVLLHLHASRIRQFHESVHGPGKRLLRWMFHTADHSVVLGEVWRRWAIDSFQIPPERISIIHNGVPASPPRPRTARQEGPFHLLFLGNLQERKGVSDLLRALARPELRAYEMRVTLAGGGPVDKYRQMASDLGIADRVRFTGWVAQDEARALTVDADALILPSYDEGLPLVILEALASGTPVICTPVGSIPEVLKDQETALLVPPGDEAAIAAAVLRMSQQPDLRAALAEAGAALYQRLFTMDAFAHAIARLYDALAPRDMPNPAMLTPGISGHR